MPYVTIAYDPDMAPVAIDAGASSLFSFSVSLAADPRGQFVSVFSPALTAQAALHKGLSALGVTIPAGAEAGVYRIDVDGWDAYIAENWEGFVEHFPRQAEIADLVARGVVFYGPFLNLADGETAHD